MSEFDRVQRDIWTLGLSVAQAYRYEWYLVEGYRQSDALRLARATAPARDAATL